MPRELLSNKELMLEWRRGSSVYILQQRDVSSPVSRLHEQSLQQAAGAGGGEACTSRWAAAAANI